MIYYSSLLSHGSGPLRQVILRLPAGLGFLQVSHGGYRLGNGWKPRVIHYYRIATYLAWGKWSVSWLRGNGRDGFLAGAKRVL